MALYSILFLSVAFLALTSIGFDEPRLITSAKAFLICAVFWVLSFSRWRNGTDWPTYIFTYRSMAMHGTLRDAFSGYMAMEPGYLLANLSLGWLRSYHLFLLAIGLVVIGLKLYRIIDLSVCATFSCLIYFCSFFGDVFFVRQSIAISICFFAIKYLLDRKPGKFVACVLIATMFHYSAIVFLLALPAMKEKPRSIVRDAFILAACALLSVFLLDRLVSASASVLLPIQYFASRLSYVTENQSLSTLSPAARNIVRLLAEAGLYFFFLSRARYIEAPFQRLYSVLLYLYFVGTVITCCFSLVAVSLVRFGLYFSTSEILLFPLAILSYRGLRRPIVASLVVGYSFVRLWILMQPYYKLYVPYHFFGLTL